MANNGKEDDINAEGASGSIGILNDLITRSETLLSELEELRSRLRLLRQDGTVEMAHFRGTVQSELNMLQKLAANPTTTGTNHIARSSNLPFLETVWSAAKGSRELVALHKRILLDSGSKSLSHGMRHVRLGVKQKKPPNSKLDAVLVDAVTDGGRTWLKCSLITNHRLLFDLAKQGWESDGSQFSDDEWNAGGEGLPGGSDDDDDDHDVPLLKTAKELAKASKLFRVRTKHPSVSLILPRIRRGETGEVDRVLENCSKAGVTVICGGELPPMPSLSDALPRIAPDPFDGFSDTVNIDCTILLALISDFSHAKVSKEPWFHAALQRQVEIEGNENLLPSLLYPAMRDRKLVCTHEAASRMREIVATIGTSSEKARAKVMLGDDGSCGQSELVSDMQLLSAYSVPENWQLPVRVVESDAQAYLTKLPEQAAQVSSSMTSINQSVFLYGWMHNLTTITSNRTVVKQLETSLGQYVDLDDTIWPRLYLCPTARSLVGKEKRGTPKGDKDHTGAWLLPDPLRREEQRRNGLDVLTMREGHEVEDLRPDGYPCEEVLAAKEAAYRVAENIPT